MADSGEVRRFSPGRIDYEGQMADRFDAGRGLDAEAERAWQRAVARWIEPSESRRVLDLGSGTGRFSKALSSWFDARVIAVEPSKRMRSRSNPDSRVLRIGGRAERLPLRGSSVEAAWLSNVIHHLPDRAQCAEELRRVLRAPGLVFVKGAFGDRLDGYTLFRHFPDARRVCEEFPTTSDVKRLFESAGFEPQSLEGVTQQTASSLAGFAERTRTRADTALELMPDDSFEEGQARLEAIAAKESRPAPVFDTIDLLVLRMRD